MIVHAIDGRQLGHTARRKFHRFGRRVQLGGLTITLLVGPFGLR